MKFKVILLAFVAFILAALVAKFAVRAWFVMGSTDRPDISITVESGWDAHRVSETLEKKGIIDSAFGYRVYALMSETARHPREGTYFFFAPASYQQIARTLALGPPRNEIELQIIEGWSVKDIAQLLATHGVTTTTLQEAIRVAAWQEEFPFLVSVPAVATLEGYLFPNTYRVWADQLPESLIKKQLAEFERRVRPIAEEAQRQRRELFEVVTLASIVEKEVARSEDRKIVAGIFLNRLRDGLPLQSDATVNYITGSGRARSTLTDTNIDSPYNTYRVKGLPPGPISNPGFDALDAAIHPTQTDYRYFLTDEQGRVYYARTFAEHQQNRVKAFGP